MYDGGFVERERMKQSTLDLYEKKFQGVCPFCGEDGFDLTGLKSHLQHGDCEVYEVLENPPKGSRIPILN
jgi:hypothetical protein